MTDTWIDTEVRSLDIDVPRWIAQDITCADVTSIVQGGCASGAYMPAVTYHEATETMGEHGDDVFQYIQDSYGELPKPRNDESWSGIAVFYLSVAVELWASGALEEITEALENAEDDPNARAEALADRHEVLTASEPDKHSAIAYCPCETATKYRYQRRKNRWDS